MDKNKYMFRILFITMIIVIIVTISFSYAYFTPVISKLGSNILNIKSADFEVNFTTSQYFNCDNVFPIDNDDYLTKACSSTFTVTTTGTNQVEYRIGIRGMDGIIPNVNYLITDGTTSHFFGSNDLYGDMSGDGVILLEETITPPVTKNYTLYAWLEDDGTDQSDYLNGSIFYGTVFVESIPEED